MSELLSSLRDLHCPDEQVGPYVRLHYVNCEAEERRSLHSGVVED